MTVKELIEILKDLDPDQEILMEAFYWDQDYYQGRPFQVEELHYDEETEEVADDIKGKKVYVITEE